MKKVHVRLNKNTNLGLMRQGVFQDSHPFTKLLLTFFLMGSCYLITFFITTLLAIPLFGMTFSGILEIFRTEDYSDHLWVLSFFQITYSAGLFLIPALLAGFLIQGQSLKYLSAKKYPSIITLAMVILLMIITIPINNLLVEFNMNLSLPEWLSGLEERIRETETEAQEMMDMFLSETSFYGLLVNLLMISVIPAFGEEFLFRGVMQRLFQEWFRNYHGAILITAVLFSFMHFQFLGFLPRIFLGMLFGYLLVWTGSIWAPVLAHFVNNSMAVVFFYMYHRGLIEYDLDSVGSDRETMIYTLISVLMMFMVLWVIYYKETRKIS
jgi:membrane protease YdiL (CAAX protease family)